MEWWEVVHGDHMRHHTDRGNKMSRCEHKACRLAASKTEKPSAAERDARLGVERRPHEEQCVVWDTGGGVCDCGETKRRQEERTRAHQATR